MPPKADVSPGRFLQEKNTYITDALAFRSKTISKVYTKN
ncbi:MAG: hypothetical protein EZS28_039876, partial [Streblomastix strix]